MTAAFLPGALVRVRGREWVVVEGRAPFLTLRTPAGEDYVVIHTEVERDLAPATFAPPGEDDVGDFAGGRLLADAVRLRLADGAGPFRCLGGLAFAPRVFQYVPLLMALRQRTARLLVADDVGVGKTIEAGLIAAELLARGEVRRFAVLCPPHLCAQWREELAEKFCIEAQCVTAALAPRLERDLPPGRSLFEHFPCTVVSHDFIKSERRRVEFATVCPELVIVDEAHTRTWRGGGRQQGYALLQKLAAAAGRHLVLLTATPHSGSDDGFFNLLALLDEKFAEGGADARIRRRMRRHIVQRTRADIAAVGGAGESFPRRETGEEAYAIAESAYGRLFDRVLALCRAAAREGEGMNYWSRLALMRCVASSPAAAAAALRNRLPPELEAAGEAAGEEEEALRRHVLDAEADEAAAADAPPALEEEFLEVAALADEAAAIAAGGADAKLAALKKVLDEWRAAGRFPIVFCHYIATANYVAEKLQAAYDAAGEAAAVEAVTGEAPAADRARRVAALGALPGRVLVATDCLSEGINLQAWFDAVAHYDLSWNPIRHLQREGRVDRLGQRSAVVATRMLYGRDNPMDGALLQAILAKERLIRRRLGVSVPIPADAAQLTAALMRRVLLHSDEPAQLAMFSDWAEAREIEAALRRQARARDAQGARGARFSQSDVDAAAVAGEAVGAVGEAAVGEAAAVRRALGDGGTTRRFVTGALRRWGVGVTEAAGGGEVTVRFGRGTHSALADLGAWLREGENVLCFEMPGAPGALYLHRAHPLVRRLAERVVSLALAPAAAGGAGGVRRAGACFCGAVEVVTTVVVARLRLQMHGEGGRVRLAEETVVVRLAGEEVCEDEGALRLFEAAPARNISEGRRAEAVAAGLARVGRAEAAIAAIAEARAVRLREAHNRVREEVRSGDWVTRVTPTLPVDVVGVYVALPDRGAVPLGAGGVGG